MARALVDRTTAAAAGKGPLTNIADLVGRWDESSGKYYGFSEDLGSPPYQRPQDAKVKRLRETAFRALAEAGQVRVWNLMIDIIAQAGRYPPGSSALDQFVVEGEQRLWVHVAIDRLTGSVIDQSIEVVRE